MKKWVLVLIIFSSISFALTEEEMIATKQRLFKEHKAQKIDFINQQMTSLENKKSCIISAKDHNDILACQKELKSTMREVRKENKKIVRDLRKKRKAAIQKSDEN